MQGGKAMAYNEKLKLLGGKWSAKPPPVPIENTKKQIIIPYIM